MPGRKSAIFRNNSIVNLRYSQNITFSMIYLDLQHVHIKRDCGSVNRDTIIPDFERKDATGRLTIIRTGFVHQLIYNMHVLIDSVTFPTVITSNYFLICFLVGLYLIYYSMRLLDRP